MTQCSALNCKNKGSHRFPKDAKRRKQWEAALRIKNFKASNTARLCATHFRQEDYFGKSRYTDNEPLAKFLRKTAVPSIFSFTKIKPENPAALERKQRFEKRSQRPLFQEQLESSASHFESQYDKPLPASDLTPDIACEEIVNTTDTGSFSIPAQCSYNAAESLSISTQVDHEYTYGSINRFKDDNEAIKFYTGFESYKKFQLVYSTLSPLAHKIEYYGNNVINMSSEDQFFLTMMKLRQNKCNFELSLFFNVSPTTVSNIFITWVNYIYQLWTQIKIWPSKELVQHYMPECFKVYHNNVHGILDSTEIRGQKSKNPTSQQASWSSYNHANMLKVLVGATPGGLLSYCSEAYEGSVSDRQIVEKSDLMTKCQSGDSILADRGYTIQNMVADRNVPVRIPTSLKGKSQSPGLTIVKDRELANKRVHIKRIRGLTKTYKILKNDLDHSYIPIASKIFFICFMCCNFRESIMKTVK